MKKKYFALVLGCTLALALVGCSSKKDENSQNIDPSNTVQSNQPENNTDMTSSDNPDRGSAGIESDGPTDTGMDGTDRTQSPNVNDAAEGGGAGGTNDVDNDGQPESGTESRSRSGSIGDDMGRAADDIINGIGDAGRNVGNAARDMIDDIGNVNR